MSAPPLPDIFGNYVLGDFVEVVAPSTVSWLPQTIGWAWLGAALALLALRYILRKLRQWHHNRYRREAMARMRHLANTDGQETWLVELNKLLKLTALAGFSREQVARLSGEEWVDFLNRHCAAAPFTAEQRSLLATGTYRTVALHESSRAQLLAVAQEWVRRHEGRGHV